MKNYEILQQYWLPKPRLKVKVEKILVQALREAVAVSPKSIDKAFYTAIRKFGLDAKSEQKILEGRGLRDDIRVSNKGEEISIEIENAGNRLEFDILKMMAFCETLPKDSRGFGCLVIPAERRLGNPFISGNGKERIWDYVTKRLLPMVENIQGLKIKNILVLGYHEIVKYKESNSFELTSMQVQKRSVSHYGDKLKNRVIQTWKKASKPVWDFNATLSVAMEEDKKLERENLTPALQFRSNRTKNNRRYLRQWIAGCRFEWLKRGN